jgi:hypothetical protein
MDLKMTEILVCIDDTDNLESRGTGHLAEILRRDIETLFRGKTTRITRHQLFVSDDIPYTSHNSTMCFKGEIEPSCLDEMILYAGELLEKLSAEGSDPGLCVAVADRINERERLINFGCDATCKVLNKESAFKLAADAGVHLSEHGGTGGGVIGALAGVGLRLGGNNGRFKGWLDVKEADRVITADKLTCNYDIDEIRAVCGQTVNPGDTVILDERIKTVLLDGHCVLPVKRNGSGNSEWINLSRDEIRKY